MSQIVPMTLAVAANRLCDLDLPEGRLRNLLSAINVASELLHRNPSELPADIAELRKRLAPIHHVQAGMSPKRLANIKADLSAGLRALHDTNASPLPKVEWSEEWGQFIQSCEQPWQRHLLARFADFCSSIDVEPKDVVDDTLRRFGSQLTDSSIAKPPAKKLKRIAQTWNGVVKRVGLSFNLLSIPHANRYQAIPLSQFPESFRVDLEAWIARQSHVDVFAEEGPTKALRPTSLRNVEATVRQFATALVARGHPIELITSLATLAELDAFKEGMRFFLERNNGKPPTWLWGMGGALLAIARYHVRLPAAEIETLNTIRGRLKVDTDRVTDKNKRRLAQFDDPYNVELLLLLPRRLSDRAVRSKRASSRVALEVMHAVAIEILLVCPMRMNNLAAIDIERHFRWSGKGQEQTVSLYISAEETKNRVAIEADLPSDTTDLIRLYLGSFREQVSAKPGNWLFPMATGDGHRQPGHLSQELSAVIYRETGLQVNGHFFRHLAGKLYLEQQPGGHETVRQFLRHKKLETSTTFYTGLDNRAANRRYFDVVLSGRNEKGVTR